MSVSLSLSLELPEELEELSEEDEELGVGEDCGLLGSEGVVPMGT